MASAAKMDSLARSVLGRTFSPLGAFKRRPASTPPVTRSGKTLPSAFEKYAGGRSLPAPIAATRPKKICPTPKCTTLQLLQPGDFP